MSISIAEFSNSWGFFTILICLPIYLNQTLCIDITKVVDVACVYV